MVVIEKEMEFISRSTILAPPSWSRIRTIILNWEKPLIHIKSGGGVEVVVAAVVVSPWWSVFSYSGKCNWQENPCSQKQKQHKVVASTIAP